MAGRSHSHCAGLPAHLAVPAVPHLRDHRIVELTEVVEQTGVLAALIEPLLQLMCCCCAQLLLLLRSLLPVGAAYVQAA